MAEFSPVVTAEEADWGMAMKRLIWYCAITFCNNLFCVSVLASQQSCFHTVYSVVQYWSKVS